MDKANIVKKYGLIDEDGLLYSCEENSYKQLVLKSAFVEKSDIIGILFRINKLSYDKLEYFRDNIDKFEPYKYDYKNGFIKCEIWDAEFFKHKASGFFIDIRFLQSIKKEDFIKFRNDLESYENKNKI